jgi:peptide/nickel transport system permease protein
MRQGFLNSALAYALAGLALAYLSHALPRLLPGDFVTAMYAGSNVTLSSGDEAALKVFYGREESFGKYISRLLRLDWGYSLAFLTPVSKLILEALPWTLLLMGGAHLISTTLGFVLGVEAAWRRGGGFEKIGIDAMTVLEGIPEIATGTILLLVFALRLGWFPAGGAETAYAEHSAFERIADVGRHLALPLSTLVIAYLPGNFLLARAGMVMVLKAPFVETARAKGLPPFRIRYAHAARNALLPVVTRFGLRIAFMFTGALVVETIHSYPGLGTLLFNAIAKRDLPLIQGIVLFSSLGVLAVNAGLELVYGRIDPRGRYAS